MGLSQTFLALLQQRVTVERFLSEDAWGNESYQAATTERAFFEGSTGSYGSVDNDDRSQTEVTEVQTATGTMDYVHIGLRDRITLGSGVLTYVTKVVTNFDALGAPLYQTVSVSTQKRG